MNNKLVMKHCEKRFSIVGNQFGLNLINWKEKSRVQQSKKWAILGPNMSPRKTQCRVLMRLDNAGSRSLPLLQKINSSLGRVR